MPVKPIDWSGNLPCLSMENQLTNGSQKTPVKPIMVPQSINIIKVDHQSHDDDKEKYNVVADKELFKLTN
jgi:hypothetical protein